MPKRQQSRSRRSRNRGKAFANDPLLCTQPGKLRGQWACGSARHRRAGGEDRARLHQDAVAIGRRLLEDRSQLFSMYESPISRPSAGVPLAVSSTLHALALAAMIFIVGLSPAPLATSLDDEGDRPDNLRLVFRTPLGRGAAAAVAGCCRRHHLRRRCGKGDESSAVRCQSDANRNQLSRMLHRRSPSVPRLQARDPAHCRCSHRHGSSGRPRSSRDPAAGTQRG